MDIIGNSEVIFYNKGDKQKYVQPGSNTTFIFKYKTEVHYLNKLIHRDSGLPAYITYNQNGDICCKAYYKYGNFIHCDFTDKPLF